MAFFGSPSVKVAPFGLLLAGVVKKRIWPLPGPGKRVLDRIRLFTGRQPTLTELICSARSDIVEEEQISAT